MARPDDKQSTVDLEMGADRPASDALAMERARARAELALFGEAEPARIGRYQVLDPIAGGGMGVVYRAHDPELDRGVALKVLHPRRHGDARLEQRLITEARALAKLDHPSVVKVHDVVTREDGVVIVMELAEGETLAQWGEARDRSWREILDAYIQAGQGLAAAHAVDVVHRDFKPSNVVIGAHGRVRVLDFGLARFAGTDASTDPGPEREGTPGVVTPGVVTAPGAFLGTPAYASPEQLDGGAITAASDQFSFCVALHRAIEGVPPFAGSTIEALAASIRAGEIRIALARSVPVWLRAALRRGLAAEPERRYPSMRALLRELARPRGWRRWRWPIAAAALVTAAVATTVALTADEQAPTCDGGASELATAWNADARRAVQAQFARIGTPYAQQAEARILAGLDERATDWGEIHRAACLAHRNGTESGDLLDRKIACLRQQLAELSAAVDVLRQTRPETVASATDVVARMAPTSDCADANQLAAGGALPAPAMRARVAVVERHLAVAIALDHAGRSDEAVVAARATVDEATATAYQPVLARALLAEGKILMTRGQETAEAATTLLTAAKAALANNLPAIAVEASARRIYLEGMANPDLDKLRSDLDYVDAMSQSLAGDHFVRPLLLNNVGTVYLAAGKRDLARQYFQLARDALRGVAAPDLELAYVDANLAMFEPDGATRAALARGVWERLSTALGPDHLSSLEALTGYAVVLDDATAAYRLLTTACASYRLNYPTLVDRYADCEQTRGYVAAEAGLPAEAEGAYAAAVDAMASSKDLDLDDDRRLAAGELALLRGDPTAAIADVEPVRAAKAGSEHWWERKSAFHAELVIGLADIAAGHTAAAVPHLVAAVSGYEELARLNEVVEYKWRLVRARAALASVDAGTKSR